MTFGAFLAIWAIHLAAAMSPGPAVILAARTGMSEGRRTGDALAIGFGLGAVIWAFAALAGLALVFEVAPRALVALKLCGAGYLLWLAVQMWRHAADPIAAPEARSPRSTGSAVRLGIGAMLANPKPAVFFGAVFAGLLPPGTGLGWYPALLAAVFLNDAGWTLIVARAFAIDRVRRAYARAKAWIDRGFGLALGALGLRFALP